MILDALFPVRTASVGETEAVGKELAKWLGEGDVVALIGDLGAGKTHFVRGVIAGLGGDPDQVSSPTFTIAQEYATEPPTVHLDLYRLKDEADARDAGAEEYLAGPGICLVEWPERARGLLPPGTLVVRLTHTGGDGRLLELLAS